MTTTAPLTRRELRETRPAPSRRARMPVSKILGEVLLWLAAVFGVICLVLVILAYTMSITLIMFRTGSMSPTIPAGSVAVVQRIPASEISVGDVVTVDREGQLPVTHRVTSVAAGDGAESRTITMKGDANQTEDPSPYVVESVRIVRFSIPGLAPVIVSLGHPFVLGGITLAASVLVAWAFWPRSPKRETDEEAP